MQRPICLIFVSAVFVFLQFLGPVAKAKAVEIRKPVWAGKFYPATRSELMKLIETLSDEAAKTTVIEPQGQTLKAVVFPHAGYIYSGWTAAHSCNLLKGKPFKKIILMGPDHRIGLPNVAISDVSAYETPLGVVPLHKDAARLRIDSTLFYALPASDQMEHSLEVVLPFLQYVIPNFAFIPMVMGRQVDIQAVSSHIADLLDNQTLVVVSSDLSHYRSYDQAKKKDKETISMILHLEDEKLLAQENAACGVIPLCTVIRLADRFKWSPKLIHYSNSGDTAGTKDKVVGYTAIAFYGDNS